jgi:pyruvate/2-oxoglutarate dehydrogenase complex dihydrolipoamide acyltransferase (E2) component
MTSERHEIRLPDLGEVDEVTVVEWLKPVGESLAEGDDLVEVETQKTTFVVPAPASGRLSRIVAHEGEKVRIDDLLGEIEPP